MGNGETMMEVFYFGVPSSERAGHYWTRAHDGYMKSLDGPVKPIDGHFAPWEAGWRDKREKHGVARTVLVQGCTVVQWWDSSGDSRPGSNSSFVVRGVHTFDEVMRAAREQHPEIIARFHRVYGREIVEEGKV
jgi:hypothetical protein